MYVSIEQLNESTERYHAEAIKDNIPGLLKEKMIVSGAEPAAGNIISTAENLRKRKKMLATESPEPLEFAYERAIGKNDSVYSNFIELISDAKSKVARIVVKRGSKVLGHATGFMVSDRLLMTNWHVFKEEYDVLDSEIEFGYELDIYGRHSQPTTFKLSAGDFFKSNKDLDYCFVAVSPVDISGKKRLSEIGYIYLNPNIGKLGQEGVEFLNIIHHPDGDFKQLSIRENKFTKIMPETLWYESDTAQGSSGSPVFNDQWQVVALHHMGVPSRTADGKHFLDKKGKIIEPVNNEIDIDRIHWIANEGIRISVIIESIYKVESPFIDALKKQPVSKTLPHSPEILSDIKPIEHMDKNNNGDIQISLPASLMDKSGNVTVIVNNRNAQPVMDIAAGKVQSPIDIALAEEIKKAEVEQTIDFSDCKGYVESFLSDKVPMPKPKKPLNKYIATLLTGKSQVLKYYHYSVLFHSVRRVPAISAINVDGNMKKRLDETERVDVWLRDRRIDPDIQLNDKYYSGSGFDKGHMSRREDANWGSTAEDAKLHADYTCFYTNACQQVPTLNRSNRSGLWGKLEKMILEDGATDETGKVAKISVFNGPIFKSTDPVYKGVQVPMEFWKIVLWYNTQKKFCATAFKLSQEDLVDDIEFELAFDKEFTEFQCTIKSLDKATGLDFSNLFAHDTFKPGAGAEEIKIESEEALRKIIKEA